MVRNKSISRKVFELTNYFTLILLSILCIAPVIHILAISLSSNVAVMGGKVTFWPVDLVFTSYSYLIKKPEFWHAYLITFERVGLGLLVDMIMVILTAYPLSKENHEFKFRTGYAWIFFITMLFSGGLIPTYMVVRQLKLIDSIWALILPSTIQVFNMVLLLNFFRQVPKELGEAAFIDGAGQWRTLWSVYLPVSKPALATIALYIIVFHWNSWFDGVIYMNRIENYPLQTYLRNVVVQATFDLGTEDPLNIKEQMSDRTLKAAQIFLAALPVLAVYPFLQKYFVKGMVVGSVKG